MQDSTSPRASGPDVRATGPGRGHLGWIPAGAAVGFALSFLFGDRITLSVDLYYLIYFAGPVPPTASRLKGLRFLQSVA